MKPSAGLSNRLRLSLYGKWIYLFLFSFSQKVCEITVPYRFKLNDVRQHIWMFWSRSSEKLPLLNKLYLSIYHAYCGIGAHVKDEPYTECQGTMEYNPPEWLERGSYDGKQVTGTISTGPTSQDAKPRV
jgi:hypothetical protein